MQIWNTMQISPLAMADVPRCACPFFCVKECFWVVKILKKSLIYICKYLQFSPWSWLHHQGQTFDILFRVGTYYLVTQQTLLLPSNRKSRIAFRLIYLRLTLTHFKGQEDAHFDCNYLGKGNRAHTAIAIIWKVVYWVTNGAFIFGFNLF